MRFKIEDPIGHSLLFIFLSKPLIDLFWSFNVPIGPARLSPTIIFGVLVFIYYALVRIRSDSVPPPLGRLIETFLVLNFLSICIGFVSNKEYTYLYLISICLRILDGYLIFYAAFIAYVQYAYKDVTPFVRAVFLGTASAMIINFIAIQLGFGGAKVGAELSGSPYREAGLYYDPGSLANYAFFNLLFGIFFLKFQADSKWKWTFPIVALGLIDIYLISITKSRMVLIEIGIVGVIYLWYLHKGWGRVVALVVTFSAFLIILVLFPEKVLEPFSRFESDITVLRADNYKVDTKVNKGISLGKFERLGSRRVGVYVDALNEIVNQSIIEIMFGNFFNPSAHSDYIDILARNGVFGLILYMIFLSRLTIRTFISSGKAQTNSEKLLHCLAFSLVLCFILSSVPFRPLLYTTTTWIMFAFVGMSMGATTLATQEKILETVEK